MAKKASAEAPAKAATARTSKRAGAAKASEPSMIDDIKKLVSLMVENDLTELNIHEGQRKILLKRGGAIPLAAPATAVPIPMEAAAPPADEGRPVEAVTDDLVEIRSPMVGTFYTTPSPDSDPFVSVGTVVTDDDVIAVVEAMKVMNEIKADCSGTIMEICVKNSQPVEFGQVLFKVRPV